ncbi:luciferase [Vibrio azureus]|uniref:LPS-assembly lipoprotein LptE n=1 Tax=Vibrio azureus NBRC 104587 TaxID=1219077 RepID=U3AVW0_9VIBR|nr:LPS assembly lipoprotein LptE [Vibrio azureus]AUI85527.1 luciferase [Vibrio azureus]GAD77357.1 lipopolysaccharide assembly lipoprotein LptE [Vibrio azureus NBRC 104587]
MRSFSLFQRFVILALAGLLSACGFHLRGDYDVPEQLHEISFSSYDQYSALTRNVLAQLKLNKVTLLPASSNIPKLHLTSSNMSERTLSLYPNSSAAEKELTYIVKYQVTLPGLGVQHFTTTVSRNYLDNPLAALAKSVEREVIEEEMRKQAAQQMMRQLGRIGADYEHGKLISDSQPAAQ